jgi:8-amino-7-oxononanoate synthase
MVKNKLEIHLPSRMPYPDQFLDKKLNERIEGNYLRSLSLTSGLIDFCSNDYLGISTHNLLRPFFSGEEQHGSRGARTLAGNSDLMEETENCIATFHGSEAALIFNSGYNANVGLIAAVAQRGDIILYDALSHASIRDGIRLSFAKAWSFMHNDMTDLAEKIEMFSAGFTGQIFVITESVFSMDGDIAPVKVMAKICTAFKAHLIVDEAHGVGVIGAQGEGLVQSEGLKDDIFARIFTYGKAPGTHGAAVCCSKKLKSFLINFARSFIYTTALPETAVKAIHSTYQVFPKMKKEREVLDRLIKIFRAAGCGFEKLSSATPIQGVIVPGNAQAKSLAAKLQNSGLDVRPILYPSVPRGRERLRISLHAFNTEKDVHLLTSLLKG